MIQNPILPGFCPDPSIIRVGNDYYIANSSFEWWPGVKIYHSKDLKHYEQLPSPLNRLSQLNMIGEGDSCGVWAPDISWNGEYFWLIYTDVKTRTGVPGRRSEECFSGNWKRLYRGTSYLSYWRILLSVNGRRWNWL